MTSQIALPASDLFDAQRDWVSLDHTGPNHCRKRCIKRGTGGFVRDDQYWRGVLVMAALAHAVDRHTRFAQNRGNFCQCARFIQKHQAQIVRSRGRRAGRFGFHKMA